MKTTKSPDPDPFHITLLWDIEFDNAKRYEIWNPETKVINSNFIKHTWKFLQHYERIKNILNMME